ncbi:MAG: hypothetical protein ACI39U_01905 [Candidatus Cryptobacteroides sp.]
MKRIKYLLLATLCLASCQEKVDKNVQWPEWASRPLIQDARISADGKTEITAGENVKLYAKINDSFNELKGCTVEVKYGSNTVITKSFDLSGNEAVIDWTFAMPFAAYLDEGGFYPEVSLTSSNVAGGFSTTRISRDSNISVLRPASPASLYAIDTDGNSVELTREDAGSYKYVSSSDSDLSRLGDSFWIAERINGTQPDFGSTVWGLNDGKIEVVGEDGAELTAGDTGGYGISRLAFDTYRFSLDKLLDLCIDIDSADMEAQSQNGINYLAKENVQLIKDCQVKFTGFGNLEDMLQSDRFEILDETSAKFTGHKTAWSFYYDQEDNWMITNYASFHAPDQVWVTGKNACFPLGNDKSANDLNFLAGDGKSRVATLSAVKDENGDFNILVYLKDDYVIQPFRRVKWSTTVTMTSKTGDTAAITDGIFVTPGSDFTPGVYSIRFHITKDEDSGGDGTVADVYVEAASL